jgi:hypothetical protein
LGHLTGSRLCQITTTPASKQQGIEHMVTVRKTQRVKGPGRTLQHDLQRLATSLLQTFPDRASAIWRDQDCAAPDAEGWNIFNAGESDARLERDDEASIFPDDGSVWQQVRNQALAGVPLAIRALAHLLHWNAAELYRVIDFAADPATEA